MTDYICHDCGEHWDRGTYGDRRRCPFCGMLSKMVLLEELALAMAEEFDATLKEAKRSFEVAKLEDDNVVLLYGKWNICDIEGMIRNIKMLPKQRVLFVVVPDDTQGIRIIGDKVVENSFRRVVKSLDEQKALTERWKRVALALAEHEGIGCLTCYEEGDLEMCEEELGIVNEGDKP
jgi:hypothetical protein